MIGRTKTTTCGTTSNATEPPLSRGTLSRSNIRFPMRFHEACPIQYTLSMKHARPVCSGGILPYNGKLLATRQEADGKRTWYLIAGRPIVRGTDLRDARGGFRHHGAACHYVHAEPGCGRALRAVHQGQHRQTSGARARPGDSQRSGH